MKKISIVRELGRFPLFSLGDFVRLTDKEVEYSRLYLHRLVKEELVFRVERGKYSVYEDPLVFCSYLRIPSYISFWSALRFHDLTEQLPKNLMLASPMRAKVIPFKGTDIEFYMMRFMWGYGKTRYSGKDIFVADKEKTVIDCLLLMNTPFDEVVKALESGELDEKRLSSYALKTNNNALIKRLGYLMNHAGMDAGNLKEHVDYNYVGLDWGRKFIGVKKPGWGVIVNRGDLK